MLLFSNKLNSLTEQVSRFDIDEDMGLGGGSETMECNCGMPLCICVAPSKPTIQPNPPATIAPVALLPQSKSEPSAKSKGSTSSSNSRSALNPGQDIPQRDYEASGEGLREAIKNGDTAGVKKILKEGVDANYRDKQGMSVLHLAVLFNQTNIALLLMDHGASLEYKNAQGETPLDCAPATLQYKMREKMKST
ncbi:PREDICTED: protein phosphatase 1 regulatory subunit 16A isoform X1 [Camelina sativa]|uniref:Protein phosphatase 1 regulatory subunit 16A isoform X1 n=2 Tax=Camelina sativa TaxID=90675 RepID=A0ABM0WL53_CAMSA|nr:PREDICTED: protein phosphatase 1 regulatory subunit 16A isoform X1 [Camelina sativa]